MKEKPKKSVRMWVARDKDNQQREWQVMQLYGLQHHLIRYT